MIKPTPYINMRVKAYNTDGKYLGNGKITKIELLEIEDKNGNIIHTVDDYVSEIMLDNGDVKQGLECWWMPLMDG